MTESTADNKEDSGSIDHTDPETLRRLYWGEGMSFSDMSEYTGVAVGTLQYWMDKHDIDRRPQTLNHAPYTVNQGYPRWNCRNEDGADYVAVHRLLAVSEFGFEAVKDKVVHHKNGIKFDNRPENIEPMDKHDHQSYHWGGEENISSKLVVSDVERIQRLYDEAGYTQSEIADEYNVNQSTISRIVNGMRWESIKSEG